MHPQVMRVLAIERQLDLLESVDRVPRDRDRVRPTRVHSAQRRSPIAPRVSAAFRHVGLLNIASRARTDS
jgi:hypothetical protein